MPEKKPKDYQRTKLELGLITTALEFAVLIIFLVSGMNVWLRSFLEGALGDHFYPLLAAYVFILAMAYAILFFPLVYVKGHRLEKKYDLSNQNFGQWFKDYFKMTLVGWLLGFIAIVCVYFLLRRYPEGWWWRAAIILWLGYVLLVKFAPLFLFPLFFRFKPLEDEELKRKILNLTTRAGVNVEGVYEFDMSRKTKSANAAFTGLGSTRRILLADNLLQNYTKEEITSVVAHELGHHRHGHLPKGIAFNLALLFVFLYAGKLAIDWGIEAFGFRGAGDVATFPLLVLVFSIGSLVFLPLANAMMRHFERQADRFALQSTQNPESFISMMQKLSDDNLADPSPHPVVEFLFHSHPSISKRIAFAREYESSLAS